MTHPDNTPSEHMQRGLEALQAAVREALDRKRRLGQYAVIWRDGKLEILDWRQNEDHKADQQAG